MTTTEKPEVAKPELEQRLREAFPTLTDDDFGYHATDLYVRWTPEVRDWLRKNYEWDKNISTFTSQIDKKLWLDIPFAGYWPRHPNH